MTELGFPSSHNDAELIALFKVSCDAADFVGGDSCLVDSRARCPSAGVRRHAMQSCCCSMSFLMATRENIFLSSLFYHVFSLKPSFVSYTFTFTFFYLCFLSCCPRGRQV